MECVDCTAGKECNGDSGCKECEEYTYCNDCPMCMCPKDDNEESDYGVMRSTEKS